MTNEIDCPHFLAESMRGLLAAFFYVLWWGGKRGSLDGFPGIFRFVKQAGWGKVDFRSGY
jgi:hypothetical protein